MARQETVWKGKEGSQELISRTLSIYFIIYFMPGLACFVGPGSEFLKGIHHAEPMCSALDSVIYESCKK